MSPPTSIHLLLLARPCPHSYQQDLGSASRSTVPKSPATGSSLKFGVSLETHRHSEPGAGNRRWNLLADVNWLQGAPVYLFLLFFLRLGTCASAASLHAAAAVSTSVLHPLPCATVPLLPQSELDVPQSETDACAARENREAVLRPPTPVQPCACQSAARCYATCNIGVCLSHRRTRPPTLAAAPVHALRQHSKFSPSETPPTTTHSATSLRCKRASPLIPLIITWLAPLYNSLSLQRPPRRTSCCSLRPTSVRRLFLPSPPRFSFPDIRALAAISPKSVPVWRACAPECA
ncbi:hypothetical protein DFH06DRAFT_1483257 [Mycena polygramma]|nr:hypothetical protein DFH06DRAFT_1483257 [Mycena polygramma]